MQFALSKNKIIMLYFPPESIVLIDEANQAMHNYPAMIT